MKNEDSENILHGWFSKKMTEDYGSVVYELISGEHVDCTILSRNEGDFYDGRVSDVKYMGKVKRKGFVCRSKAPCRGREIRNNFIIIKPEYIYFRHLYKSELK